MNKSIADVNNPKISLITFTAGDSRRIKTASNYIPVLPTVPCKEVTISHKNKVTGTVFFEKIVSVIKKIGNATTLKTGF